MGGRGQGVHARACTCIRRVNAAMHETDRLHREKGEVSLLPQWPRVMLHLHDSVPATIPVNELHGRGRSGRVGAVLESGKHPCSPFTITLFHPHPLPSSPSSILTLFPTPTHLHNPCRASITSMLSTITIDELRGRGWSGSVTAVLESGEHPGKAHKEGREVFRLEAMFYMHTQVGCGPLPAKPARKPACAVLLVGVREGGEE